MLRLTGGPDVFKKGAATHRPDDRRRHRESVTFGLWPEGGSLAGRIAAVQAGAIHGTHVR